MLEEATTVVPPAPRVIDGLWVESVTLEDPVSLTLSLSLRDSETWQPHTVDVDIDGADLTVHALSAVDGLLVGGTTQPSEVFTHTAGELRHRGHLGDGEVYSILIDDDVVYLADYPAGDLWTYDPHTDWSLGTNPSAINLGDGHLRPLAIEAGSDGTLWVGSVAGYGVDGGALAEFFFGGDGNHREADEEEGEDAVKHWC